MRTRFVTAGAAAVLVMVSACTGSGPDDPESSARVDDGSATADQATAECPDGFADTIKQWGDVGFNGVVSMVRGTASCTVATGLLDREAAESMDGGAVFAIGSVSKSFTAAAVVSLAEEGRLRLSDTAGSLVEGLKGPAAAATVGQLLAHTSGLHGDTGADHQPLSRAEAVGVISRLPRTFRPGSDFGYTNAGYTVLALVIDAVSGNYRRYLETHLLQWGAGARHDDAGFWDGMPEAGAPRVVGYLEGGRSEQLGDAEGPPWAMSGNGDLAMSVPTLAAWTSGLFHGQVVSDDAVKAIQRTRWDNHDGTSETFGWVRFDKRLFGQAGYASAGGGGDTGHNVVVLYAPESDTTIAVGSSTPEVTAEQVLQSILPRLLAGDPIPGPVDADATKPDLDAARSATGTYEVGGGGRLILDVAAGEVAIEAVGAAAVEALFSLPDGVSAGDVSSHESGVVHLLTGDSGVGADEREGLSAAVGDIEHVVLQGTVYDQSELRTYVEVVGTRRSIRGWYALDGQDGVGAAEAPTGHPRLVLPQQHGHTLISVDPTGRSADVRVTVSTDLLTIDNGSTVTAARRLR